MEGSMNELDRRVDDRTQRSMNGDSVDWWGCYLDGWNRRWIDG